MQGNKKAVESMGRFGAAMAALLLCAVAYDEGVAGRRRRARPADAAGPESPRRRGPDARRRPDPDDPRPRRRRRAVDADLRYARGESRARRAPLAMATRREGDLHLVEEPAAVPPPAADGSRYVFVGGTHGSGTSLLYKLFGAHGSGTFSCFHDTRVVEDEGQKLQDVYPTASRLGGPCSYATNADAYLDERLPADAATGTRLLGQWLPWWNRSKPVLVEKSPPDVIHSLWLQNAFAGRHSAFVFLIKHPYSIVIGGGSQWEKRCRRTPADVDAFLDNWLASYGKLEADAPRLRTAYLLRFESWLASVDGAWRLFDALVAKLLARPQRRRKLYYHAAAGEPVDIRLPNMSSWALETEPRRLAKYEPRLAHFGYSLKSRKLGELPPALRTILLTE